MRSLPKIHLPVDIEGRYAEGAAFDGGGRVLEELGFHRILLDTGGQVLAVETGLG